MTEKKVVTNIPESKKKLVNELADLIKTKKTILIASIKNIPGSQFQEIVKKLRGKAIVKVPKKNLIFRAIDESGNAEIKKLEEKIDDSFAILFSDLDAFELAGDLMKNQSPAKAKVGQEAPADIEVEAGPTELIPGPAISELGSVGLQVQVENGKLSIKESRVIVKEGEKIKQNAADIMAKLDIKPFKVGFIPLCAFDITESKLYSEIKIDREGTLNDLKYAFGKALPFAVSLGYISKDTITLMIGKAGAQANKINRIMTGEPEPVAEVVAPVEEKKEEVKEEKKEAAAEGLGALFG
jgi:large subunit ribosomal protein L10